MPSIADAILFIQTFIGIPYRWCLDGEVIGTDDKFYAKNGEPPTAQQIKENDLCIVCTGIANLMRRFMGLTIPGLDGTMGEDGLKWPGTTGIWFEYLMAKGRLKPFDITVDDPEGTLYLRNFGDIVNDQGHVAIKLGKDQIIHAYAEIGYEESVEKKIVNVGTTGITSLNYSHNFVEGGYYTHKCLPEDWLIKE